MRIFNELKSEIKKKIFSLINRMAKLREKTKLICSNRLIINICENTSFVDFHFCKFRREINNILIKVKILFLLINYINCEILIGYTLAKPWPSD